MQRSVIALAPLGLLTASVIATLTCPGPLIALTAVRRWRAGAVDIGTFAQGLTVVAIAFGTTLGVSLVFGAPIWLALRRLGRESGRTYAGAGAIVGLALSSMLLVRLWRPVDAEQAATILWCGVAGALSALGFWRVTRRTVPAIGAPAGALEAGS